MRLTSREKKLLLFLLLVVIVGGGIYFFYLPAKDALDLEKSSLAQKKEELAQLESNILSVEQQKQIIDALRQKVDFLGRVLPPVLYQEDVLRKLMKVTDEHELIVRSYNFNEIDSGPKVRSDEEALETILSGYNDTLLGKMSKQMTKARFEEKEEGEEEIPWTEQIQKMEVTLTLAGKYANVQAAMKAMESMDNLAVVKTFSITKDPTQSDDNVVGSLGLMLPYYYDNEKLETLQWKFESEFKEHNPFFYEMPNSGSRAIVDSIQIPANEQSQVTTVKAKAQDFYVMMNAPSSIQARYYIGKSDAREMALPSPEKDESLFLILVKQGDAYGFRYGTSYQSFPLPGEFYPFKPQNDDAIYVQILSTPRIDSNDNGLGTLRIENKTGKPVKVLLRGDDIKNPRLLLKKDGGDVFLVNE